jgi:hypothetical protein
MVDPEEDDCADDRDEHAVELNPVMPVAPRAVKR